MFEEFKKFAVKGNVMDMAVGVIIGAAFGKIVSSFVADIIMPPIGLLLGGVDFSNLVITLQEANGEVEAITLNYGLFLNTVINFLIISFSIFIAVKQLNRFKRKKAEEPVEAPKPSKEEELLTEIRDILKNK